MHRVAFGTSAPLVIRDHCARRAVVVGVAEFLLTIWISFVLNRRTFAVDEPERCKALSGPSTFAMGRDGAKFLGSAALPSWRTM